MALYDPPRLIADIGGTYARFALETAQGRFSAPASLRCADHADFHAAVRAYIDTCRPAPSRSTPPWRSPTRSKATGCA